MKHKAYVNGHSLQKLQRDFSFAKGNPKDFSGIKCISFLEMGKIRTYPGKEETMDMKKPEKYPDKTSRRLLLFWLVYFISFFILDTGIPAEKCHVIHCLPDDWIPFCEWFLIPYVFWYFCLGGITLYTMIRDETVFHSFMYYLILTSAAALALYVLYPSRQELRPSYFSRDNTLTAAVRLLYKVDTNTNVFPSLHVLHTFGILSAGLRAKGLEHWGWKCFFVVTSVLICLSTVFLKQHSVLDVFLALPISVLSERICYGGYTWMNCLKRKTA